ncbi:hypothetical protein HK104_002350 [Borealophlyctis nickersoniae]|nr:hypothetical protein HK104_002350 [Borealophlyctis nickersoniae]
MSLLRTNLQILSRKTGSGSRVPDRLRPLFAPFSSSPVRSNAQPFYNKVTLIGVVGNEPDFRPFQNPARTSDNGEPLGRHQFSLGMKRRYKTSEDDWEEETQWHKIVSFKKHPGFEKIHKGCFLLVEGELKNWKYEDRILTNIDITYGRTLLVAENPNQKNEYESYGEGSSPVITTKLGEEEPDPVTGNKYSI